MQHVQDIPVFDPFPESFFEPFPRSAACLGPSTRILCPDFIWRPIGDIGVGDELIAFEGRAAMLGNRRKMKIAMLLERAVVKRPSCRIRFTDGREVVASPDSQWLTDPHAVWVRAGKLAAGDLLRDLGAPWKTAPDAETGWLGGVYDGEGWLSERKAPGAGYGGGWYIGFAQNPGAVLDLARRLVEERGYQTREKLDRSRKIEKFLITGMYDSFRFLGECQPVRLIEKSRPWIEGASLMRSRGTARNQRYSLQIEQVEFLGEVDVVAIETGTQTVLAEGLFSSVARKPLNRERREPRRH